MIKKIKIIGIGLFIAMLCVSGCGKKENQKETTKTSHADVAVHAGEADVYIDEVRYYLYTAQATYESMYISDGKEIDWKSTMSNDTSWEQGVKSMELDDICRRECMYAMAGEYNVTLSEDEIKSITIDADKFFTDSNKKLVQKIDIDNKSLVKVFEKEAIAEKVEDIMAASDKKLPDEIYEQWKKDNNVIAEKQWDDIVFDEHIFTLQDANKTED